MPQYTVVLADEEEKALLWDIADLQEWADNALHNKARQCADGICRLALEDKSHAILTLAEKQQVVDALHAQGIVLTSIREIPVAIKRQIVAAARIQSAAERLAGAEAAAAPGAT